MNSMAKRISFEDACRKYVHRFTMEHVPAWAMAVGPKGKYFAPQYRSDLEWYDNTLFPPQNPYSGRHAYSQNQTFPLGVWLKEPYRKTCGLNDMRK